eukprot:jgi/Botrbrau1/2245/Bobra.101_2s0073.1
MGRWTLPGLLCLLAVCGRTEARAALPSASAPDTAQRRSAIYVSAVPVAQAPGSSDFVNLPNTKAVIHLDDVMTHLRPAQGPVEADAQNFREDLRVMLQKANAVAALRRVGLLRGSTGMPSYLQNRTVEFLNLHAPSLETPAGPIKPVLSQDVKVPGTVKSFTDTNTQSLSYSAGSVIELLLGVRLATPFFGTGFNFCIDRYFGSFPKVGIVIPNMADWILPDLRDILGPTLGLTVELPQPGTGGLPIGSRVAPTSDGFLIWMNPLQPRDIPQFAFRYGVQLAQLFGVDFGFGWLRISCGVDFVRV